MGKHPKLVKPEFGQFGTTEFAIHGTSCGTIQQLAKDVIEKLGDEYRICYIDTDHRSFKEELTANYLENGAIVSMSDKQNFQQFDLQLNNPDFDYKFFLQQADLILVNGNHHKAKKQIVFLDVNKVDSLERKSAHLTDIQCFIPVNAYNVVPTHVFDKYPEANALPVITDDETNEVAQILRKELEKSKPKVKALILAGGKSERMGFDKSAIDYHGEEQSEYLAKIASELVDEVYISQRSGQENKSNSSFPVIEDRVEGMGPYGGIISAFMTDPTAAWMVLACDLPMLDRGILQQLVEGRNRSKYATCFESPVTQFPEPLIAIWEPRAYMRLLQFMSLGYSCPRKVLINSEVELLKAEKASSLMNANTPEEYEEAKRLINAGK